MKVSNFINPFGNSDPSHSKISTKKAEEELIEVGEFLESFNTGENHLLNQVATAILGKFHYLSQPEDLKKIDVKSYYKKLKSYSSEFALSLESSLEDQKKQLKEDQKKIPKFFRRLIKKTSNSRELKPEQVKDQLQKLDILWERDQIDQNISKTPSNGKKTLIYLRESKTEKNSVAMMALRDGHICQDRIDLSQFKNMNDFYEKCFFEKKFVPQKNDNKDLEKIIFIHERK